MNYKNSVMILYPIGGYGTFLEWCLMYFSGLLSSHDLPFTATGSSHQYMGNFLEPSIETPEPHKTWKPIPLKEYFAGPSTYPYVRTHGPIARRINDPTYTCQTFIQELQDYVDKIVLISASPSLRLLLLGNQITKPKVVLEKNGSFYEKVVREFANQFGITDSNNVPPWQLREMVSYWQERRLNFPVDFFHPVEHKKVINVCLQDLVNDFESVFYALADQLKIRLVNIDQMQIIVETWRSLQKFINSDKICQDIIYHTVENLDYQWQELNMIEEAFIQWQLRDFHNLDLLCYGLNRFPSNTNDLRKVLVPIKS